MSVKRKSLILVVEDEPDLREVIRYNLEREGFAVIESGDGEEGFRIVGASRPSLVLLDIMLPGMDGIEICRAMKLDERIRDIPVIMVTAKGSESDIILGLGVGADDYLTKPFSPRELTARVKAVLRRGRSHDDFATDEVLVFERLVIDQPRHEVLVDGRTVQFTPTEFKLLQVLAARPGRVFTRAQLIHRSMGEDVVVTERNIDVHVRAVRQKLGGARDLIETIRGVGYRFLQDETDR